MEGRQITVWLLLLLNQLSLCPAEGSTTTQSKTEDTASSSVPVTVHSPTSADSINNSLTDNDIYGNCLLDIQMGLIAIGSAGGLIVCLLVATVVLACQVYHIQRRISEPRTSRSNMDLVSSTGYWDTDRPEVEGFVGPCDASVMLEEVGEQSNMEEDRQDEIKEVNNEVGKGYEEGATARVFDTEEMAIQMLSSIPRDSCLVVPKDLEDMPLVV